MPKPKKNKPNGQTWRDLKEGSQLRKSSKRKPLSWPARWRIFWIWVRRITIIAVLSLLCYGGYYLYENTYFEDIFSGKTERVRQIEFKTDGVITGKWLNAYLKIPARIKLSDVNIFALKQALESNGQIKNATLERFYPDILRVTITEHTPIATIPITIDSTTYLYAMSADGRIFEPICVPNEKLAALPRIEGYAAIFKNNVPLLYPHAKKVEEFLIAAKARMPEQTKKWRRINVAEIDSSTLALISVYSDDGIKIIFAPKEYPKQFDRLEYILRYSKQRSLDNIKQIDLSLKDRSDVKISDGKTK